jgi:hypothetical protein
MRLSDCDHLKVVGVNPDRRLKPRHNAAAIVCILVAGLIMTGGTGCNSQVAGDSAAADVSRIKALTTFYTSYMNRNGGPPPSEAEFKRYIAEKGEPLLKSSGITADEIFISPRDNEPLVVLYGSAAAKLLNQGVVTYERTGVGGRRLVGYRAGSVNEIAEAEFRKLVPAS